MTLILAFACGVFFMLWLSAMIKVMELEHKVQEYDRHLQDIKTDIVAMGDSFQKCLNDMCDQINHHAEAINRHQQGIDYLTKECNNDD